MIPGPLCGSTPSLLLTEGLGGGMPTALVRASATAEEVAPGATAEVVGPSAEVVEEE